MTSRFILEALDRNAAGNLWSIDLPPVNPETRKEVGSRRRQRSRYGSAGRMSPEQAAGGLPALLSQLRRVDLFIHDSLHTCAQCFVRDGPCLALFQVRGALSWWMTSTSTRHSRSLRERHPEHPSFVCPAEPITPDVRRFNQKGLSGSLSNPLPSPAA